MSDTKGTTAPEEREHFRAWAAWATGLPPTTSPAQDFAAHGLRLLAERDALASRVSTLEAALGVQRNLWESLSARAGHALERKQNKGGQHVGIPDMYGVPTSQLLAIKRDCRDAMEFADVALAGPHPVEGPPGPKEPA